MATDWLDPNFKSPFEAEKDIALKDTLACAGQWATFSFSDSSKPDERVFVYFEREHEEVSTDGEVDYSTNDPFVECRYADFDNVPKQNDFFQVVEFFDNVELTLNFKIIDRHEPDEQGAIAFILELINGSRAVN